MAGTDCADGIAAAFRGRKRLSEDEIQFITEELRRRSSELPLGDRNWQKIAQGLVQDIREAAFVQRRNARLNVAAKQRLLALAREADQRYNDPALGLEAAMVGTNSPLSGGNRRSVAASAEALLDQYAGEMVARLDREGLISHLNDGHLDPEIARALEKITKPEALGSTNPEANRIAQIIHEQRKAALDRQNRAGSWVKPLKGYITTQGHDQAKLRKAGFEKWRDFVLPLLDPRTFGDSNPGLFLREAYRTLVNGEQLTSRGADIDLNLAFKGPANLAKRVSQHRVLHFANADAWAKYNGEFGPGTLREAILGEFASMAHNTALMEGFGPNPGSLFDDVNQALRQEFSDDPKKVDRLRGRTLQAQMDEITGHSRVAQNVTAASVGKAVRGWTNLASLGGVMLSSVTDLASKAAEIRYQNGGGVLTPFAQSISTFFEGMGKGQKRELADRVRAFTDGMLGSTAERFGAADTPSGTMGRLVRLFFKLNLLTPWTDANKRGLALFAARTLGAHAATDFAALPDHMRFILGQYGIDAPRWEVARQAIMTADDGSTYLIPDIIQQLPQETFLRAGLDPLKDRDQLETAIRTFFVDTTEFGVPTPGARERAMLTLGFKPGTVEGESLRMIMQFKSFPLTVISKVWGRQIYGNPDGKKDLVGMAMFLAASTFLGYLAMSMKALQRGLTPPDPTRPSTILAAFTQGGGAGIYGDFLLGQSNRFGHGLLDTLAGPTLGTIADIDELRAKLMSGDDPTANAVRLAMNKAPFVNLFYTRMALDYLILFQLQEMSNPGYLRRREQYLQREQGQSYLLPAPSSVIPRGGGNRIFEGVR